jgi:hypothetical protein
MFVPGTGERGAFDFAFDFAVASAFALDFTELLAGAFALPCVGPPFRVFCVPMVLIGNGGQLHSRPALAVYPERIPRGARFASQNPFTSYGRGSPKTTARVALPAGSPCSSPERGERGAFDFASAFALDFTELLAAAFALPCVGPPFHVFASRWF